jgi:quercetin dioxygenase-like cupin family protein
MESRKTKGTRSGMSETGTDERRAFLQALLAAALTSGVAAETVYAQQAPTASQTAGGGRSTPRQPLPAPFTGMDAAFALLTVQPGPPQSRPHMHSGFVLGYVIEGDYLFAINGETPRVVHAGEIFYEPQGATHTTSASAKPDQPVKLLAIVIGPKDAAVTLPAR